MAIPYPDRRGRAFDMRWHSLATEARPNEASRFATRAWAGGRSQASLAPFDSLFNSAPATQFLNSVLATDMQFLVS